MNEGIQTSCNEKGGTRAWRRCGSKLESVDRRPPRVFPSRVRAAESGISWTSLEADLCPPLPRSPFSPVSRAVVGHASSLLGPLARFRFVLSPFSLRAHELRIST
jgi:hypothetical protein